MPSPEEEKIIICSASVAYYNAKAIVDALDVMLIAVKSGPARAEAEEYDAAIRPHAEAIIATAKAQGADDDGTGPDSPATA